MLKPDNRRLFLEALKPPVGYHFDRGIGTTFTLNLITLLITPLSLSMLDRDNVDEMLKDPLILLEGLKRLANKLTIFCQSGYISIPQKENYLYSYLEDMIVQVKAPNGGVFHPKIWLLRYTAHDSPVIYRLLSLSRNLTFDRSWDLMIQLDGEVADRVRGYSRNRPLNKFIQMLPDLSIHPPNHRVFEDTNLMADEVRKVKFNQPQGFEEFPEFYPSGIPGFRGFNFSEPYSRVMLLSPFLTNDVIHKATRKTENNILISSTSEIDQLSSQARDRFEKLFVFDEVTDAITGNELSSGDEDPNKMMNTNVSDGGLNGLHAKLFVMENSRDVTWLIGSANATTPAFSNRNVEFMIGLKGKRRHFGIEKILGEEDNEFTLLSLLQHYKQSDQQSETHPDKFKAEKIANQVRMWLVDHDQCLRIMERSESTYDMEFSFSENIDHPEGEFTLFCWPISLPKDYAQELKLDRTRKSVVFENLTLLAITPFMAFEINTKVKDASHTIQFVIKVPIKNPPPNRDNVIISKIIDDKYQFVRYLRLLLSFEEYPVIRSDILIDAKNPPGSNWGWKDLDMPLFEDLVRALSRYPDEKIDRIENIVNQIKQTPEAEKIIPVEFDHLWQIFLSARNELE